MTYVLLDPPNSGPKNMAGDLELLSAAEQGRIVGRVYCWDGLWVSLGHSQKPEMALCDPSKTPWVMRPTGGLAVLHGHDVTVALALPITNQAHSIRSTYRLAVDPLVRALNLCGIEAMIAEDAARGERAPGIEDCFAVTSKNDVVHARTFRKICGCALRRTRTAVLLQASIPVSNPLATPCGVIVGGVGTAMTRVHGGDLAEALNRTLNGALNS